MPQFSDNVHTTSFYLGSLRILGFIDHVFVHIFGHHPPGIEVLGISNLGATRASSGVPKIGVFGFSVFIIIKLNYCNVIIMSFLHSLVNNYAHRRFLVSTSHNI